MELNAYQAAALETAIYPGKRTGSDTAIIYTVLGLANEAGEAAGKLKKFIRGDYDGEEASQAIADELGDVLWYLSCAAMESGYTLENIAEMNIRKLADRASRGVIKGNGDKR